MAEVNTRDAKLIQYLNEAYGKEKQLETALQAHIAMTTRAPYKKRLQEHLRETKGHARELQRRIKALGGKAETVDIPGPDVAEKAAAAVQEVAHRAAALAQGPLHAVRGTSEQEKMLKNARDEYQDEHHEIAQYTAIETLATSVGDRETAQLAKRIRREEEKMANFLQRLIPTLTKSVATSEIPAAERRAASGGRRRSTSRSRATASSRSSSSRSRSGSSTRARSGSSSRSSSSRSGSTRASSSRSGSSRSSGSRSGSSRSSGSRSSSNGRSSSSSGTRSRARSSSRS